MICSTAQLREIKESESVLGEAESNHAALALTLAALRAHVRQEDERGQVREGARECLEPLAGRQ